jgi:hypothetical protein
MPQAESGGSQSWSTAWESRPANWVRLGVLGPGRMDGKLILSISGRNTAYKFRPGSARVLFRERADEQDYFRFKSDPSRTRR